MRIRVLIADDEPSARERLRQLLAQEEEIDLVAECGDGAETLARIRELEPDLVFLDVRMPEMNGFEVIEALPHRPSVIFVTAYERHALDAFNVSAVDYLLKPFDQKRFRQALHQGRALVERSRTRFRAGNSRETEERSNTVQSGTGRIVIRSAGKIAFLSIDEIDWIKGAGNYAELHAQKAMHLLRETLRSLERRLPPQQFARINKSLLVNMTRVQELRTKSHGDATLILHDGTRLPVSRTYRENLKRKLLDL